MTSAAKGGQTQVTVGGLTDHEGPLSRRWSVRTSPGKRLVSSARLRCGPAAKERGKVIRGGIMIKK